MNMFGYACDRCREKHQSCNHELPCKRCLKANVGESCHYTAKRTRTKSSTSRSNSTPNSSSNSSTKYIMNDGNSPNTIGFNSPLTHQNRSGTNSPMNFNGGRQLMYQITDPATGKVIHTPIPPSHMNFSSNPQMQQFGHQSLFFPTPLPFHPSHPYPPHMMPYSYIPPGMKRSLSIPTSSPSTARSPFVSFVPVVYPPPLPSQTATNDNAAERKRRKSQSALSEAVTKDNDEDLKDAEKDLMGSNNGGQEMPYPELLDGIHYAASQHYTYNPCDENFNSMDGSALMASGVLVQEYIRDALAMIHEDSTCPELADHVDSLLQDENKNSSNSNHSIQSINSNEPNSPFKRKLTGAPESHDDLSLVNSNTLVANENNFS